LYELNLKPGSYYLLARSQDYFAYYGRNPVTLPQAGLADVNLALVASDVGAPAGEPFVTNGVLGQLSYQGAPLGGAMVYVYLDLTSDLKGMGYVMAGPTDAAGIFEAELPPGSYYLLARKRQSGSRVGPLSSGDFIGYYPGNPIRLTSGEVLRLGIPMLEVPDKVDALADILFGQTVFHGVIRDHAGHALEGLRAVLYTDAQMLNRPLYVSQPTTADGRFTLSLPKGGTYFLAARNTLGGAPAPGDLYGSYDGTPDHSLVLQNGQVVNDIEILVEKMW
jgi:hypothetical protein